MTQLETTLTSADPARPRRYRVALDGRRLVRTAWSGGRRPRETVTDLAGSDHEAEAAFAAARDRKMREGFCRVGDAANPGRGDTVLEMLAPNRCPADAFDLAPDGRTLVLGTMLDQAYGAEIHLVDVATGHRRLVHAEPAAGQQTFVHAVRFDADGRRIVYALNGETRLLDPDTGATRLLASYRQYEDAAFNPFRARPTWDAARTRLLVFDAGERVRILDRDGAAVFETARRPPFDCWAGGLSRSGRLLALCHARGSRYQPEDPETVEVDVWDVDTGTLRHRIPMGRRPARVGFDPSETLLVCNPDHAEGPCAFALESGALTWWFPDEIRTDRWAVCYDWEYSPDGRMLAVGRRGRAEVVDAATRERLPAFLPNDRAAGGTGRTSRVRFSDDGALLATGGDSGRLLVRAA
ncbi:WD40 repeat domain-containing protein [Marinitenerispora sediminis]|uniref:WGR domain-containing protein n=1 Tax=Marinitenerispora sediminis TaxID=1931232 RepID=A0A368T8H3_9ACTN|nr:WD40 repeat domain-containing protein [Marinitenerispora sediminis]RCV48232.1 hypothetical protein DEF28_24120 [Marinitenerispora sediminis]RCV49346.1 hypothetical protein DEF23_23780 [Marinitenerispora sediminis]RCV58683.1 hypothetical protein DEF24_12660 [Marinitenerispora sediminis]